MTEISFRTGMVLITLGWVLFRTNACRKQGNVNWKSEWIQSIFLVNLLVIARFTFYPFSKVDGQIQPLLFDPDAAFPFRVNLIPFVNLTEYVSRSNLLVNVIGNFAMFIPTGIITPLIYRKRNRLQHVAAVGFGLSLAIEVLQLPFSVRATDVDDLILNTAGCLAGYGIYVLVCWIRKRKKAPNDSIL